MTDTNARLMSRVLELARQGMGRVEPNPLVGCVVVRDGQIVGEGWHHAFGEPHAEVEALRSCGPRSRDATLYVNLEPCCHTGKTPPCTDAIIAAGVRRVVVAMQDPFPHVAGRGIRQLQQAGIEVQLGVLEADAQDLNAPYIKLLTTGRPWVIAKWAMTLDGRIATRQGSSRWISGEPARAVVHRLRGRVDAILVGRGTVAADDPLLTARPAGARTATRIVLDSNARLSPDSQLVRTVHSAPLLVAASPDAPLGHVQRLREAGCEVLVLQNGSQDDRLAVLLDELGRRRMTNLLVEGGSRVLGSLFDARLIDEAHVFVATKLVGGFEAPGPIAGTGIERMRHAATLRNTHIQQVGHDLYLAGRLVYESA